MGSRAKRVIPPEFNKMRLLMKYAKISGIGSYLPEKVLTNHDLEAMVDTTDEWITERSGIKCRHIAADDENVVSMAEIAARQAIKDAGILPEDLDLILVGTCTSEHFFPSTACLLQSKLKAKNAAAMDLSAACTGFVYGLSIADQYIRTGMAKHVLVVGSETLSRVLDWQDRTTCVLFGDGAGAAVLSASDEPGILASKIRSDGDHGDVLKLPTPIRGLDSLVSMQGREVFKLAVNKLSKAVDEILEEAGITKDQVDWFVPHQANVRIINMITRQTKLDPEKVIVTLEDHANTSTASIPLAFHDAVKKRLIKRGDTVLFEAFGGGLTWGSVLFKY